jgi:hypothetical protein
MLKDISEAIDLLLKAIDVLDSADRRRERLGKKLVQVYII